MGGVGGDLNVAEEGGSPDLHNDDGEEDGGAYPEVPRVAKGEDDVTVAGTQRGRAAAPESPPPVLTTYTQRERHTEEWDGVSTDARKLTTGFGEGGREV